MEHSCHKCGHPVEDGIAFCAQCGAPQIRVAVAEPEAGQSVSGGALPQEIASRAGAGVDRTGPSQMISWAHGLPAAALAGMIAGVGMMFIGLFGLWMLAAGFLSVLFYRRRTRGGLLFPWAGARLGAVGGMVGFAMFALVTVPTGLFRSMMLEMIRMYASQRSDPQLQALTERWLEVLKTPEGVAAFLLGLFIFLVLASAVGGALGGAFLSRGGRRQGPFSS
jgi:zinc ribbon protein